MITTLGQYIGIGTQEEFADFDLSEIEEVLQNLRNTDPIDLAHVEHLQQQTLRGADILTRYLGSIVKTVGYLEAKVNSVKNKVSLEYQAKEGRTTTDMKIWAGQSSPEVEQVSNKLAEAKAAKMVLEKKFDLLVRAHHHWKDISSGMRRTVLGYSGGQSAEKIPAGYE